MTQDFKRIAKHGSITAAARSMDMSYRHAWKLVDSMNRQSRAPVVTKTTGGHGGGGSLVTPAGLQAIACFWAAYHQFQGFLKEQSPQLEMSILSRNRSRK
jgi:molybdate transport system regulatory protein